MEYICSQCGTIHSVAEHGLHTCECGAVHRVTPHGALFVPNGQEPSSPLLSPWFAPSTQQPWEPGEYELRFSTGANTMRCWWDGEHWLYFRPLPNAPVIPVAGDIIEAWRGRGAP